MSLGALFRVSGFEGGATRQVRGSAATIHPADATDRPHTRHRHTPLTPLYPLTPRPLPLRHAPPRLLYAHTQVAIGASADGCAVLAGERIGEVTVTCTVDCAREPLLQILRGEVEPLMALSTGQVQVDDLGQLMAFKMSFNLNRAAFDAYLASRPSVPSSSAVS